MTWGPSSADTVKIGSHTGPAKRPDPNTKLSVFSHADAHRGHGLTRGEVGSSINGIHHPQPTWKLSRLSMAKQS